VTVTRTGGIDMDRYYRVWFDDANGFAGPRPLAGLMNGGWVTQGSTAIGFRVRGVQPAGAQVAALVETVGQFLMGCELSSPVLGASSCPWRSGDLDGLTEAERLLGSGSGASRLLALVRDDRSVYVRAAPVPAWVSWWLRADGSLVDQWGDPLPVGRCPYGGWVGLADVVPGNADVSHYARLSPFWVEGAVYDVAARRVRLLGLGARGLLLDDSALLPAGDVAL
jgi:hypothetical protein